MAFLYIQQANVNTTGTGTGLSTPAVTTTAGNHLFVHLMWSTTAATTASVTDTAGNTYIPVAASMSSGGANSQWFYCLNALGHASNVVTQTLSVGRGYRSVRVMEFSGTSPVFEQLVNAKSATGNSLTSGAFSTAAAGLVLAGQSNFNGETVGGFGTNYTTLPVTFSYSKEAYRITTGPLTGETITYTGNASTNRTMDILTFVEGGGTATNVYTVSAEGGIGFAGGAMQARAGSRTAVGGVQLQGAATQARGRAVAPTGGWQFSGVSSVISGAKQLLTVLAAGGLALSGAVQRIAITARTAVGGLNVGGTAGYTNSGVVARAAAILRRRARPRQPVSRR